MMQEAAPGLETAILLERIEQALDRLAGLLESSDTHLTAGGANVDRVVDNFPMPGIRHLTLSDRRMHGHDNLVITAQTKPATLVVDADAGRAGGEIVNLGSQPCFLYLSGVSRAVYQQGGIGALWLLNGGGSWDFKLSDVVWQGPVSAISPSGTTLAWATT